MNCRYACRGVVLCFLVTGFALVTGTVFADTIKIGSKKFTESVILGEMAGLLVDNKGIDTGHQRELGGTRVLWGALLAGEIDVYPEYTGTLIQEILVAEGIKDDEQLHKVLGEHGIRMTQPLGFNNTYALGMQADLSEQLEIRSISDLRHHPDLVMGFGSEFMNRADGWPGLKTRYQLPHKNVRGLDHDLAYRGIASDALQVIDLYATDAEIDYYNLRALKDDLGFFPAYHAVFLYRADLEERAPAVITELQRLTGQIDAAAMTRMNSKVKIDHQSESLVASNFLERTLDVTVGIDSQSAWSRFWQHTLEHLYLVAISLSAAILVALPLGIAATRRPRLGHIILAVTGIIQTIPSLALFVFMIPLLGIGGPPAIVALFLYSLLPIVRNTHAGLTGIPQSMLDSADALGLPRNARLRLIELPLGASTILAGIKTSAVINIGTATLAALIGAGGYGQPILTGIRLDDIGLILQGAVPAAVLALAVQGMFELGERWVVPRGLRSS